MAKRAHTMPPGLDVGVLVEAAPHAYAGSWFEAEVLSPLPSLPSPLPFPPCPRTNTMQALLTAAPSLARPEQVLELTAKDALLAFTQVRATGKKARGACSRQWVRPWQASVCSISAPYLLPICSLSAPCLLPISGCLSVRGEQAAKGRISDQDVCPRIRSPGHVQEHSPSTQILLPTEPGYPESLRGQTDLTKGCPPKGQRVRTPRQGCKGWQLRLPFISTVFTNF
ncbi:hypothetical protein T492DRAFT_287923 [Pavlovales sp. CCMP2436]|nr:hypothetical protein T492DRAFT_287923 [Pavlovales sp. CCMP2436]